MTTRNLLKKLEKELGPLTFAMFMRNSRTALGLTQQQMADELGMARGTICDIEKGRQLVSVEFAKKVATKAGFSVIVAVEACFMDQLRRSKLKFEVKLKAA